MILIPSDSRDFAYTVHAFQVGRAGTVRVALSGGEVRTVTVKKGEYVVLPVRRLYATGTTSRLFQTDIRGTEPPAIRGLKVPYATVLDDPPVLPPPPPVEYDGNPLTTEVSDDGTRLVFTFEGVVVVTGTITVTVNGDPQTWSVDQNVDTIVVFAPPEDTLPIEDDDEVTVTYSGGTFTPTPTGDPNDPVTDGPVTNGSTVPGGSGSQGPTLVSATVTDAYEVTLVFDEPVYATGSQWSMYTDNNQEYNNEDASSLTGEGTDTLVYTFSNESLSAILFGMVCHINTAEDRWRSVANDTPSEAVDVAVTNNSPARFAADNARVFRYDNGNDTIYTALELTFNGVVGEGSNCTVTVSVNGGTAYDIVCDDNLPSQTPFGAIWRDNTMLDQIEPGDTIEIISILDGRFILQDSAAPSEAVSNLAAPNEVV